MLPTAAPRPGDGECIAPPRPSRLVAPRRSVLGALATVVGRAETTAAVQIDFHISYRDFTQRAILAQSWFLDDPFRCDRCWQRLSRQRVGHNKTEKVSLFLSGAGQRSGILIDEEFFIQLSNVFDPTPRVTVFTNPRRHRGMLDTFPANGNVTIDKALAETDDGTWRGQELRGFLERRRDENGGFYVLRLLDLR